MTLHPSATYSTRNPRAWGDLQSKRETDLALIPAVVDMTVPASNEIYWQGWALEPKHELAKLVQPEQLAAYLDEIAHLTHKERYCKLQAQVYLEKARRLQEGYIVDDEPLGGWY